MLPENTYFLIFETFKGYKNTSLRVGYFPDFEATVKFFANIPIQSIETN